MKKFILLFACLALFIVGALAQPTEVWVDDDYDEFTPGWGFDHFDNIPDGMNAVEASGTVNVAAGNYAASVTLNKAVTLNGANAGIHPAVGTHPTETVGTRSAESILSHNGLFAIRPAADNITIDGFLFSGDGGRIIDTYADANSFHLTNCIFDNNGTGNSQGVIQFGGGSHTDCLFDFNLFQDDGQHTIYTGGGPFDGLEIKYNKFNVEGDPVFWTATPLVDGVIEGNEFDGTIDGTPGVGCGSINIGQAGNLIIKDNHFHDIFYTPFQVGIIGGSIYGNTIERVYPYPSYWASAMELWGGQYGTAISSNVDIYDNTIYYNDIPGAADPSHGIRLRAPETGSGIDGSTIHIYENNFLNAGERTDAYGIRHQGDQATTVDADYNFWGDETCTFVMPTAALFEGPVDYQPYYADCARTTLYLPEVWVDDDYDASTSGWGVDHFDNIQDGIAAVNSGGTVNVYDGTYPETGQIVINQDVSIVGDYSAKGLTTITPTANTGSGGDARGWFLVADGIEFNLSNVTLDGTGFLIYQGIRYKGFGTIDNVTFYEIKYNESGPTYGGVAIAAFGGTDMNVHVSNSHFSKIGRVGVLYFGAGITGSNYTGNTYVGKGPGNWIDYALDISSGAIVTVDDCTITDCEGVASSDGSTSAGILVTTYYGPGTSVLITNSTITGNTTGIHVGYDAADASTVEAHLNNISGNDYGIINTGSMTVDALSNYWGDPTGPFNDPLNLGGAGNEVEGDNILFDPWYVSPDFGDQIDVAIRELDCSRFEVVLRPNFDPMDFQITNVQFTVKYPESVDLIDLNPELGLQVGATSTPPTGYKYITYVGVNLSNIGWTNGNEYIALTFGHDQSGSSPDITGDFSIVSNSEATVYTQYYAEYLGSDATGYIFENAPGALLTGCPVWNETQDLWYYQIQSAIDEANDPGPDIIRVYNVVPNNGVFAEDIIIDRPVFLYGPNVGICPDGVISRVDEVVIHPATSSPYGEIIKVQDSDVTIDGFTIDGDNPNLTSGFQGTNGADLDAAEAVTVYVDNVNNMTVQNNIIKNLTYFGVTIFGASYSAPSTSGHLVDCNKFQDMGTYDPASGMEFWGGGVLIYNDQYTRITYNIMTNVRMGIQTGNFHNLNPGLPMYQVIDYNIMQVRRRGIFYNLHTGDPVALTLSNNTITGLANPNETVWDGILMSSLSDVSGIAINNTIDGTGITVPSEGYEIWNVKSDAPALISEGSVSNVDIGVFANNYEGYSSDGDDGAHGTITGMTITPNAGGTGIYLKDSPSYTGAPTTVELEIYNNVITGGAEGILLEETIAGSVTATANDNNISSNSGFGVNSSVLNQMDATCNWWGTALINGVAAEVSGDVVYLPFLITDDENIASAYPDGFDPLGPCASPISAKVWLQGPYDITTHLMKTDLNGVPIQLPNGQPFNQDPWNYAGAETLPSSLPAEVVDWVLIELRTTATGTSFERAAGLLYEDGSVVANFVSADQSTPYYIVVYHRNHMPVMSENSVDFESYAFPYDFTVEANLYGPGLPTPVKAAMELETGTWGMIAGDVTKNGELKYSGPGNDRGAIISKIISEGGTHLASVINDGYWFEDVNMNNQLMYNGSGNDRAFIIDNLIDLLNSPYLNNIYTSVVPGAYTGSKDGSNEGPFDIQFVESAEALSVEIVTNETVADGLIDNIQFTLAWKAADTEIADMLNSYTSDFMLAPQGEAYEVNGVMHMVYVSVTPVGLPAVFDEGEQVSVLSFVKNSGLTTTGRLWIADNEFTTDNNAMYYVSNWGNDVTGMIMTSMTGVNDPSAENMIRVYPNPAHNDFINLELNLVKDQTVVITITDMQGKTVISNEVPAKAGLSVNRIELNNPGPGVYLIKVLGDDLNTIEKLVIR